MLARLNWHPTPSELRYFANTLALLGIFFAIIFALTDKLLTGLVVAGICVVLAALIRIIPVAGRLIYVVWMIATFTLSLVVSPMAIALIYYLILTPMSLIARLSRKDDLHLKRQTGKPSYFEDADYDTSPDTFHRQF